MTESGVNQGSAFARSLFLGHLTELANAHPLVMAGNSPEALHDFRVALRKLRSNLKSLDEFFEDQNTLKDLEDRLGWLDNIISAARDADVLQGTVDAALKALRLPEDRTVVHLRTVLKDQILNARARLEVGLKSKKTHDLLVDLTSFLRLSPLNDERVAEYESYLAKLNQKRSKKLAKRVLATDLRNASNARLHSIRIECKRVRYLAEASLPVLSKNEQKHIEALIKAQTMLGLHNDLAVAIRWTKTVAKKSEVKPGLRKHLIEQLTKTQEVNDRRLRNKLPDYLG